MRIAAVSGPDPGHAFPVISVADALRRRAHEVVVVTGSAHRAAVEASGLTHLELPLLAPTSDDVEFGHRLWGRAAEMAPPLAALLSRWRPELVVADTLTRAGAFAAELLGCPWVEVSPHHLTDPSVDLAPIGLGRRPSRRWWRRIDDARLRELQRRSLAAGQAQRVEARRRIGLPADGQSPLLRLFATLPGLEYARRDWPATAHVVGPLTWEPATWPLLGPPPGDAPLIVVTDSTASNVDRSLARTALVGLRHTGLRLVVTTGRDDLPPSWHGAVVGQGPHGPLLDAAAVAVGPGGHGFVAKALSRAVPLVLVPLQGDQRETAARVRHAGAGRSIPPGRLTPRRLRWAVLRVLHDQGYREAAHRLAEGARGLGPDHAARLIEVAVR